MAIFALNGLGGQEAVLGSRSTLLLVSIGSQFGLHCREHLLACSDVLLPQKIMPQLCGYAVIATPTTEVQKGAFRAHCIGSGLPASKSIPDCWVGAVWELQK